MKEIKWRPYQIACKTAIKEKFDKGVNRQLIVAATGVGKRLMSVNLIQHFKRTLFIAHREELIIQAHNEINLYFPFEAGIIKAKHFEIDKRIVIASVQTLYNRLDKIDPSTFDLVIVDESHHYISASYLKTVRHFTPRLLTGWTATPKRLDGLSLSNLFQEIVFQYKIEDGISEGFLAPVEAYQINTNTDISRVKRTAGDFNIKELSVKVDSDERNELIVKKYLEYAKNRQAIAYCVDIDHAYHLRNMFRKHSISCETVVSDNKRCPNRTELFEKFSQGKFDVLTNVNIATEGYDYSDIGCILMARPTQSETLYVQAIGRATRIKSEAFQEKFNTDKAIILDFVDNTGKFSLINSWELEKDKPIEERIFVPQSHKEKLIAEKEKRERMIKLKYGKDKQINLFVLPEVKPWNSPKMLDPATEKQIEWIKSMGIWQEGVEYTKAMASELISNRPANNWQKIWLAERNYDVSGKVTLGQYQKVKWVEDNKNKYAFKDK